MKIRHSGSAVLVFTDSGYGNMSHNGGIEVEGNREKFQRTFFSGKKLIVPGLVHGGEVAVVNHYSPSRIPGKDAVVTKDCIVAACVNFADCLPILAHDPESGVRAAIHGGYGSLLGRIIPKTFDMMERLGAKRKMIRIVIGPGIREECYEFGPEAEEKFSAYPQALKRIPGRDKFLVSLEKVVISDCLSARIMKSNIIDTGICTKCQKEEFFSARGHKMGKENLRSGLAVIADLAR